VDKHRDDRPVRRRGGASRDRRRHWRDAARHPGHNPNAPISDGAFWVHGIADADVADAPAWPAVLPRLLEVTAGKVILAYNAEFDSAVIVGDCARYGLDPAHLAQPVTWGCLMNRRSDWLRTRRWLRLDGGHRALGDTHAAREVLVDLAEPRGSVRSPPAAPPAAPASG
jgi:DNA polymerase III epsilon subunit-like protein